MNNHHRKYNRVINGNVEEVPPVWLMRQAGRYLPEYRELRQKYSFLEVCHNPELATEVTLQPIRRFGFDASILFSDILVPLVPMGADLEFSPGPTIANPLRHPDDLKNIRRIEPREDLSDVLAAVTMLRRELPDETALIGFAGAPFTLATYWIEGGKPEPFANVKRLMYNEPDLFRSLLEQLGGVVADYLLAQAEAGADAVQLFDTWAGFLPESEFNDFLLPVLRNIFDRLKEKGVRSTYYVRGSAHLVQALQMTGADVISLDWRVPLEHAKRTYGVHQPMQGNLDPTVLLGGEDIVRRETRGIISEMAGVPHVFNLGHGILPMTPISSVEVMLDEIRNGGY